MLSDRRQRILAALIEEYVACAMPVGSRTLTERYRFGVSSATIRNELSALESNGYITQPHTSAGRIPTDYGYRAFVDHLLESDDAPQDPVYAQKMAEMRAQAREIDSLLAQTSEAIARFTDCLSIVLAPSVLQLRVKQISLISMSAFHALIVLVTEDGQVFNRHMDFGVEVAPEELAVVQNHLNSVFRGKTTSEVSDALASGMEEVYSNPLVGMVVTEVIACLQESGLAHSHRLGLSALLTKPEFSHAHQLLPLLQVLEDDTVLLELVDDVMQSDDDPTVRIGSENKADALSGVSVVAGQYGRGSGAGIVAVIGPTRMDYSRVIQAVRLASHMLDDD